MRRRRDLDGDGVGWPGFSLPVTSNWPRMKAPFSSPSFSPFSQISAA
jgi:hypothetical protein